ncbi:MAG TPA: hypothetical protein VFN75_11070, partial [Pseudonocardiaceae bacterium]|nr:hypothetical protein [Pseudonocardiaceae bacterium]
MAGWLAGLAAAAGHSVVEAAVATSTVVVFGILIWVLVARWRGRVSRRSSSRISAVEPSPAPLVAKPVLDCPGQAQPALDL